LLSSLFNPEGGGDMSEMSTGFQQNAMLYVTNNKQASSKDETAEEEQEEATLARGSQQTGNAELMMAEATTAEVNRRGSMERW
jgi:hypothetical protein